MMRMLASAILLLSACATTTVAAPPVALPMPPPPEMAGPQWRPEQMAPPESEPSPQPSPARRGGVVDNDNDTDAPAVALPHPELMVHSASAHVRSAQTDRRSPPSKRPPLRISRAALGKILAERASQLVGVHSVNQLTNRLPDDCTGFVRYVYEDQGINLLVSDGRADESGVANIWRRARMAGAIKRSRPKPGDIVFFRETYDRNHDGRRDDGLTHVGIVESISRDGTVTFVHHGSKGIARSHLNLRHPREHRDRNGEIVNDYLRPADGTHRAYLTGELVSGFATPSRL